MIVDRNRLELVGPDLLCSEWLLRNGAAVRFKGQPSLVSDYNVLMEIEELPECSQFRVEEIYAKDVQLNFAGFEHMKGCKNVEKITLIKCRYINRACIIRMTYVKESLKYLEIRSCYNLRDDGLQELTAFSNLQKLILSDLPGVKRKAECKETLQRKLVNCDIQYD
ncbi:hypothetical protein RUM44_000454 [Polyplax serrata]|uniref:ATP synthase subunit s, mitochondrial n=1 Tax=Polyplax serrata TaxID=468196 RepID=A0ABR1B5I1_POLSC